ncbi:hypothetical protein KVT40_000161 [Elsinoe batatas]|uniref:Uncharacterized protein n=1 Tax=Elsinoe batatas TaxID=2601811 RepID=A0A8K0PID3_9PEZI|nr:hypothetical protein KVT40_000161 [Elsinoe batatas]
MGSLHKGTSVPQTTSYVLHKSPLALYDVTLRSPTSPAKIDYYLEVAKNFESPDSPTAALLLHRGPSPKDHIAAAATFADDTTGALAAFSDKSSDETARSIVCAEWYYKRAGLAATVASDSEMEWSAFSWTTLAPKPKRQFPFLKRTSAPGRWILETSHKAAKEEHPAALFIPNGFTRGSVIDTGTFGELELKALVNPTSREMAILALLTMWHIERQRHFGEGIVPSHGHEGDGTQVRSKPREVDPDDSDRRVKQAITVAAALRGLGAAS